MKLARSNVRAVYHTKFRQIFSQDSEDKRKNSRSSLSKMVLR